MSKDVEKIEEIILNHIEPLAPFITGIPTRKSNILAKSINEFIHSKLTELEQENENLKLKIERTDPLIDILTKENEQLKKQVEELGKQLIECGKEIGRFYKDYINWDKYNPTNQQNK